MKKTNYKARVILVLVFIALVVIFLFVNLRGKYLNILEIGQNYINVFWQNIEYQYKVMGVNFIFLFFKPK